MTEELSITFVTGFDGWGVGGTPSEADRDSFCALVEERLAARYPEHLVEAHVYESAIDDYVVSNDPDIDVRELCRHIVMVDWADWCGGDRARDAR